MADKAGVGRGCPMDFFEFSSKNAGPYAFLLHNKNHALSQGPLHPHVNALT